MFRGLVPCLFVISFIACSGSRETTKETPIIALQSSSSASTETSADPPIASSIASVEAPPPVASVEAPTPETSAIAGPPTPYPESWIMLARGENIGLSCTELVYKNGCSQTRTGIVTFEVTIDEAGSIEKFTEVRNEIRVDKALVSKCLKKNLPKWKFHPPEGHLRTFQIPVALADRC